MFTLRLLLVVLLEALASLGSTEGQPLRGTVVFRVVFSATGAPLPGATLTVRGDPADQDLSQYLRGKSLVDIPYGTYELTIRGRGMATVRTRITVDAPRTWRTVGLTLEAPEYGAMEPSMSGTVMFRNEPVPTAWIKVVGVYSDTMMETMADSNGNFRLDGLGDGLYLITADAAEGFVSKPLLVSARNQAVLLELGPRPGVQQGGSPAKTPAKPSGK